MPGRKLRKNSLSIEDILQLKIFNENQATSRIWKPWPWTLVVQLSKFPANRIEFCATLAPNTHTNRRLFVGPTNKKFTRTQSESGQRVKYVLNRSTRIYSVSLATCVNTHDDRLIIIYMKWQWPQPFPRSCFLSFTISNAQFMLQFVEKRRFSYLKFTNLRRNYGFAFGVYRNMSKRTPLSTHWQ